MGNHGIIVNGVKKIVDADQYLSASMEASQHGTTTTIGYGVVPTSPRPGESTFGGRYEHATFSGSAGLVNTGSWDMNNNETTASFLSE